MKQSARRFVAGLRGTVGSAIVHRLSEGGDHDFLTQTHAELDLVDQSAVNALASAETPEYILIAAAKVGGIHANNRYRADFIYHNLMIEVNLVDAANLAGVQRQMLLGSSCINLRDCPQPIREERLLAVPFKETNEPYATAKIAGLNLWERYSREDGRQYACTMSTNLYGPNDNYDLVNSHVAPAVRKAHGARERGDNEYLVWGSSTARREFLHVDDLADACGPLMETGYAGPLSTSGLAKTPPFASWPKS